MLIDIPGYEGICKISSDGEIFSAHRNRVIKGSIEATGYLAVSLCKNGTRTRRTIHTLLAEIFIPNINNLPEVNHIDGVKLNNSIQNLEWITIVDNIRHAFTNKLTKNMACIDYNKVSSLTSEIIAGVTLRELCLREGIKEPSTLRKLLLREAIRIGREKEFRAGTLQARKSIVTERSFQVRQLTLTGSPLKLHDSINAAGRYLNKNPAAIWKAINKQRPYLGFIWEKANA